MIKMPLKSLRVICAASVAAIAFGSVSAPSPALAQQCEEEGGGPSKVLRPRIATPLGEVFEQMQNELYQEALAALNQLIANRENSMSGFERATTYELRGSVKANLEDYGGAQRDFQVALNTGELPENRNNQLRYFIAQLNFQAEDYQAAIRGLNTWIQTARACNQRVDPNAYYLLSAAYVQIQPPNYRQALSPAENAVRANEEAVAADTTGQQTPRKGYYDLLNLIYSELGDTTQRGALLEKIVGLWPGDKGYWTQLSGLYSQLERDRDAFAVLEVAYRAGLLTTESELKTLIQYYSFFNNPYRGATMLEREIAAGNIERDQENLVLLSQLWSQSREHTRAIPILREAAGRSADGELSYRLGMVLLADEQYQASQRALQDAIRKGGLDRDDTGDAYLLLGTARFSQAGPEDTEIWSSAREAFVNAQRYQKSAQRASEWIAYIDAVADTYRRGKELERLQELERCQADLARLVQQERIRELQNRQPTPEELAQDAAVRERCGDAAGG